MRTESPQLQKLAIGLLVVAPENVRKTPADKQSDLELRTSILNHGLFNNLTVTAPENDGEPYRVIAGGRRLAAIQSLIESGDLPADYAVPVNVVNPNGGGAEEMSLAENLVRASMHPADQIETFSRLVRAGSTFDEIANRFGISPLTVKRRVALADVAPSVLQAFREGEIKLDILQAFTVTSDIARQAALLDDYKARGSYAMNQMTPWAIKSSLSDGHVHSTDPLAVFVTLETYEKAGGRVDRDLFASSEDDAPAYLLDQDILRTTANAMLAEAADRYRPDWNWVEYSIEAPIDLLDACSFLEPKRGKPTVAQTKRLEQISERLDEMEAHHNNWTDELQKEWEQLDAEKTMIDDTVSAKDFFKAADRKRSGVALYVDRDGDMVIHEGLVKPQPDSGNQAAGAESGVTPSASAASGSAGAPQPAPNANGADPNAQPPGQTGAQRAKTQVPGLSDKHAMELGHIRSNLLRNALLKHPTVAVDYFTWENARRFFANGYRCALAESLIKPANTRPTQMVPKGSPWRDPAEEQFLAAKSKLPLEWNDSKLSAGESFQAFLELKPKQRQSILAYMAAASIHPEIHVEGKKKEYSTGALNSVLDRIGVDFTAFRPDADTFWKRVTKDAILEMVETHLGADRAAGLKGCNNSELVEFAVRNFGPEKQDPATAGWSVPGFAPEAKAEARNAS